MTQFRGLGRNTKKKGIVRFLVQMKTLKLALLTFIRTCRTCWFLSTHHTTTDIALLKDKFVQVSMFQTNFYASHYWVWAHSKKQVWNKQDWESNLRPRVDCFKIKLRPCRDHVLQEYVLQEYVLQEYVSQEHDLLRPCLRRICLLDHVLRPCL